MRLPTRVSERTGGSLDGRCRDVIADWGWWVSCGLGRGEAAGRVRLRSFDSTYIVSTVKMVVPIDWLERMHVEQDAEGSEMCLRSSAERFRWCDPAGALSPFAAMPLRCRNGGVGRRHVGGEVLEHEPDAARRVGALVTQVTDNGL